MGELIKCENLAFSYEDVDVIKNLSFFIPIFRIVWI